MKLYVSSNSIGPAEQAELRTLLPAGDVCIANFDSLSEADRRAFLEADAVLGTAPVDLLPAAHRLRWIQFTSVGIDGYRQTDWSKYAGQITCTNLRGILADPMAQTILGGLLALNRGIDQLAALQPKRDWQKMVLFPQLQVIHGAHVLLLGAGSVNQRLRELLTPYHCRFTVYARTSGDIHTPAELDAVLPTADIVSAALPDTPGTRDLLNAARIARFKPTALFANVGRGSLVDEAALIAALQTGRLRGAVIDVTRREPLPPDDPFWTCPRTILTQHTSGGSNLVSPDVVGVFKTNLARYRAGQPLLNVVDWAKGY